MDSSRTARDRLNWNYQVTENFRLGEFLESETARQLGIQNEPKGEKQQELVLSNIFRAAGVMQMIRRELAIPLVINSCYRNRKVNKCVGGSPSSLHLTGCAVDFCSPSTGIMELWDNMLMIRNLIPAFRMLLEPSWIHLEIWKSGMLPGVVKLPKGFKTGSDPRDRSGALAKGGLIVCHEGLWDAAPVDKTQLA